MATIKPVPEQTKEKPVDGMTETQEKTIDQLNETKTKPIPKKTTKSKETPPIVKMENAVEIGGKLIEIKPTKLKYFRNKTAAIYSVFKVVPINEFIALEKGVFDDERDSDQILFDFLIAVFDDPAFVKQHYDEIDTDVLEKIFEIFGRINHITEKEEAARKNKEAQAQMKR